METIKQDGAKAAVDGQRMSNPRMVFIGAMVLAAFYVVWGIVKMIS